MFKFIGSLLDGLLNIILWPLKLIGGLIVVIFIIGLVSCVF